ncbi:bifunctional methionine sulfoxide reductase B/A protein [Paracrocinitomix mangrovi]|uniref:bifunctional methionine sulfoxide reductase B/A protein n=1 Tax=Paracrocinitomix mangrovi TaxID=2862509 RepID=UPI001C8EBB6A|nr:bifunctional methionine sulfoxide reductase B/A protein [Paracrocinitomix mangrovi]UKN01642.1 bifunctional methionine sulfoxide reductase B/A protein [Paracrocinitomix mangrovi]
MVLKIFPVISLIFIGLSFSACGQSKENTSESTANNLNKNVMKDSSSWNKLTSEEERVIVNKGTEMIWKGEYINNHDDGTYLCKRCNAALFKSSDKFDSGSGWPAFDDAIEGAVKEIPDADGYRTEIVCANCNGHLGHVFKGEHMTSKNTRHCVNSISLNFVAEKDMTENVKTDTAIFASGCFWGTEYFMEKAEGVISTQVGYIGGHVDNPTYKQVCSDTTGHAEAVRVVFDPSKTDYETLAKLFFETHDPSQVDRQGPDIGKQYRSEIFYLNDEQKAIAEKLKAELISKGTSVATNITKATTFWEGEDYHEHYYAKNGSTPYCHGYTKRF